MWRQWSDELKGTAYGEWSPSRRSPLLMLRISHGTKDVTVLGVTFLSGLGVGVSSRFGVLTQCFGTR